MPAWRHGFRAGAREQRLAHEQFLFRGIPAVEEGLANLLKTRRRGAHHGLL